MPIGDLVSQKEAAAILNRSISAVSRAIKEGRLEYAEPKNRLLYRPGLEQRFAQMTRPRIDAPQRKSAKVPRTSREVPAPVREIAADYWERLAEKVNFVLEGAPAYWAKAPDAHHLKVFCRTLDELRIQVEAEGLEP